MLITAVLHLWGIQRDLPYVTEDAIFMSPAVRIAATGDLNPREFGNPGSTLIYPLAAIFHVWNGVAHGGSLLHANPNVQSRFKSEPGEFYLLARLLTVAYAVASVPLVYLIGRPAFGDTGALIGALFAALHPTEVFDKRVRTDSASLFFGLLGLWGCLRLYERRMLADQIFAGAAIGLAIASKYYLGTLVGVLVVVDLLIWWRQRTARVWIGAAAGLFAVALAFALSTPYFLLDYATASKSLQVQLRTAHPGADGLSPTGNLLWYLSFALPNTLSWPQTAAAVVGIALLLWRRTPQALLLLLFSVLFVIGISRHGLHWQRWLIPICPVLALFAASALEMTAARVAALLRLPRTAQLGLIALGAVLLVAQPARQVIALDRRYARLSTYVLARQWVEEHLPAGSRMAYEWETLPPPLTKKLTEIPMSYLSVRQTLDYYSSHGVRFLVTSSVWYAYYPANAAQYPAQAAFYQQLLSEGHLLHTVESSGNEGPEIRIYEIGSRAPG